MDSETKERISRLETEHTLPPEEYEALLRDASPETAACLAEKADAVRRKIYGRDVYVRGLIEISSFCRNDCLYCGLRRSNAGCERYRLSPEDILDCCATGYALGFRTFVLQGGEDAFWTDDRLELLIGTIRSRYPACAVTLSLGERSRESYRRLYEAGAERYLLRHETANPAHYARLHAPEQSLEHRMACLYALQEIGYQTGCGFMVGSPFQTMENLVQDLQFIRAFQPAMCGIGPFIPHHATPFAACPAGSVEMTCRLLSIIRLLCPHVLLPATTALGTLATDGRERGIRAGANVVMPNLSPSGVRKKYELYNNKLSDGAEAAECKDTLAARMRAIGYEVVVSRGDVRREGFFTNRQDI